MELELPNDLDITELDISGNGLIKLPDLTKYTKLVKLNCSNNQITSLDNLPHTLIELDCHYNNLTSLDNLPSNIKQLICYVNKITSLDNLPLTLEILNCSENPITNLDYCHLI